MITVTCDTKGSCCNPRNPLDPNIDEFINHLRKHSIICKHCDKLVINEVNGRDVYPFLKAWLAEEITTARLLEILEQWANQRDLSHCL